MLSHQPTVFFFKWLELVVLPLVQVGWGRGSNLCSFPLPATALHTAPSLILELFLTVMTRFLEVCGLWYWGDG